ncbi:MAG: hypothetical protein Q9183_005321, partial [Haloplaca sp. 2 TL-2023]
RDKQEDQSKSSNLAAVNAANQGLSTNRFLIAKESAARSSKREGQLERVRPSKARLIRGRQGRQRSRSVFSLPDGEDEHKSKRLKLHSKGTQAKSALTAPGSAQNEVVDDEHITKSTIGSQKRRPGRPKSQVTSRAIDQVSGRRLRPRKTKSVPSSKDHPGENESRANRGGRQEPHAASPDTEQHPGSDQDDVEEVSNDKDALMNDAVENQRQIPSHKSQAPYQEHEEGHIRLTKHAENSELRSKVRNDNEYEGAQKSRRLAVEDAECVETEGSPEAEDDDSELGSESSVDTDPDVETDEELGGLELFGKESEWKRVLEEKQKIGISERDGKRSKRIPKLKSELVKTLVAETRRCIEAYEYIASEDSIGTNGRDEIQGNRRLQNLLKALQRRVRNLSEDQCKDKRQTIHDMYAHAIPEVVRLVDKALKVRAVQLREPENFDILEEVIGVLNILVTLCYEARHWSMKPGASTAIIQPTVQIKPLITLIHKSFKEQLQKRARSRAESSAHSIAIAERRARTEKEKHAAEEDARRMAAYARVRSEARDQNPHLYQVKCPSQLSKRPSRQISNTVSWTPDMDRELLSVLLAPSNMGSTGNHASTLA